MKKHKYKKGDKLYLKINEDTNFGLLSFSPITIPKGIYNVEVVSRRWPNQESKDPIYELKVYVSSDNFYLLWFSESSLEESK